jgi:outer membrane protein assembly factor BamB
LAVSAGWPVALHDAAHSGTGAEVGPQSGALLWTRNLGGPISGGPAVSSDGTIYAFSNSGVLHALNPQTGADIWTYDGGGSANNNQDLSTTPAVLSDGSILWPGPRSTLFALSASGHLEWTFALRGTVLSPAVANGRVYVADSMGDLVALEASATSVTKMWELSIGTTSFGSPAVAPGGTVYGTADRSLVAIKDDGTRGRILWRFTDGADIEVSPSVAPAGTVVLGTNDSYEYGISPKGTVEWRYLRKVYSYSTPAVTPDGLAYFGDNNGYVDVVKAATGRVVGRYDGTARPLSNVGVGVWTAPLIDRHHDVYFGTAAGHVFGFTYSGAKLFDLSTGATVDSYPALTPQGTLIIGSDNGTLYAIG